MQILGKLNRGLIFILWGFSMPLFSQFVLPVQEEAPEQTQIQLGEAQGIPHKVYKTKMSTPDPLRERVVVRADLLSVEFGKVSQEDFNHLQEIYHGEKSVPYSPDRNYNLIDFLPRFMQATLQHQFRIEVYNYRDGKWAYDPTGNGHAPLGAKVQTNCYTTAYEFLRNDPKGFQAFYVDSKPMEPFLLDEKRSKLIKTVSQNEIEKGFLLPNKDLKFGDVLIMRPELPRFTPILHGKPYVADQLNHVAIYIDNGIFFEKTAASSQDFYRLVDFKTIAEYYAGNVFELRRITIPPDKMPNQAFNVPSVQKMCSFEPQSGQINYSRFCKYEIDPATGRYVLTKETFSPDVNTGAGEAQPNAANKEFNKFHLSH